MEVVSRIEKQFSEHKAMHVFSAIAVFVQPSYNAIFSLLLYVPNNIFAWLIKKKMEKKVEKSCPRTITVRVFQIDKVGQVW